jgi:hypothetical protein
MSWRRSRWRKRCIAASSRHAHLLGRRRAEPGFSTLLAGGRLAPPAPIPATSHARTAESRGGGRITCTPTRRRRRCPRRSEPGGAPRLRAIDRGNSESLEDRIAPAAEAPAHHAPVRALRLLGAHLDVERIIDRSMEAMIQLTQARAGLLPLIEAKGKIGQGWRGAGGESIEANPRGELVDRARGGGAAARGAGGRRPERSPAIRASAPST